MSRRTENRHLGYERRRSWRRWFQVLSAASLLCGGIVETGPLFSSDDPFLDAAEYQAVSLFADAATDDETLQSQKQKQFDDLKHQIDALSKRLKTVPPVQPPVPPPEGFLPIHRPEALPQTIQAQPLAPAPDPFEATSVQPPPVKPDTRPLESASRQNRATHDTIKPDQSESPIAEMSPVDGPIDRFALASSLFGSGEFTLCLNTLDQTNLNSLGRENRLWGEYMQACCHRQLGNLDLARTGYRRILSEAEAGWIGELAKWWLANLEEKDRLRADIQQLSSVLATWEKEVETFSARRP